MVSLILLVGLLLLENLVGLLCDWATSLVGVQGRQFEGWQVDLFAGLTQEEGMKKPVCMVHGGKDAKTGRTQVYAHGVSARLLVDHRISNIDIES